MRIYYNDHKVKQFSVDTYEKINTIELYTVYSYTYELINY